MVADLPEHKYPANRQKTKKSETFIVVPFGKLFSPDSDKSMLGLDFEARVSNEKYLELHQKNALKSFESNQYPILWN